MAHSDGQRAHLTYMGTCNQLIACMRVNGIYSASNVMLMRSLMSSGMYYKCLVRSHIRFLCEAKCAEDNRKRLKPKQIEKFL